MSGCRWGTSLEEALGDVVLGDSDSKGRVAVAIPDATRPLDPVPALHALRCRASGDLQVVVGLGLHRRMLPAELAHHSARDGFTPVQHDPDDVRETGVVDGIPGFVSRHIDGCSVVIGLGIAELHQYAGISGGHKAVAVGLGGRATIAALHHRDRVIAPGVEVGRVHGNPFRDAIDGLGQAAGCTHALLWVPDCGAWVFGDPVVAVQEAAARMAPWVDVDEVATGAVLRVPPAKASSLYQASRAATYLALSPRPPLRQGAVLVLEAEMPEGLGSEAGFRAALQERRPPWSSLLRGRPPQGPGAQRAVMLALLARRYRLMIAGCQSPETFVRVGISATDAPAVPEPGWLDVVDPFHRLPQLAPGRG